MSTLSRGSFQCGLDFVDEEDGVPVDFSPLDHRGDGFKFGGLLLDQGEEVAPVPGALVEEAPSVFLLIFGEPCFDGGEFGRWPHLVLLFEDLAYRVVPPAAMDPVIMVFFQAT
jgi:hypothetical protein